MEMGVVQTARLSRPAPVLPEYLLVVRPEESVYRRILDEKKYFTEQYQQQIAMKSLPHITVANFLGREEMESTLLRWMHRIISNQPGFRVKLNNYGGFNPHTLYIRVEDAKPFQQLAAALRVLDPFVKDNGCPPMYLVRNPHLTIARKLPADVYQQASQDYLERQFQGVFDVNTLLLLRRDSPFSSYKQVQVFGLRPA
jgi:2'-5' RNA ligase